MQVLQRPRWTGIPVDLGELFVVTKNEWLAICKLTSHPDGWELCVYIGSPDNTITTQICRSDKEVSVTVERWKRQLALKGWA